MLASGLRRQSSDKQCALLKGFGYNLRTDVLGNGNMNKYAAACHLTFQFNRMAIERTLNL